MVWFLPEVRLFRHIGAFAGKNPHKKRTYRGNRISAPPGRQGSPAKDMGNRAAGTGGLSRERQPRLPADRESKQSSGAVGSTPGRRIGGWGQVRRRSPDSVQIWGPRMESIEPEDILAIASEGVPAFIREQAGARSLSPLMKRLNRDLLSEDEGASALAARALRHLGFVDRP
jgi:hypothetical protein